MASSQSRSEDHHVLSTMRQRISQLEGDNAALRTSLLSKEEEATQLTDRLDGYKARARDVVNQWMASTNEAQRRYTTCAAEKEEVENALARVQRERDALAEAHAQMSIQNAQLASDAAGLRSALDAGGVRGAAELQSAIQEHDASKQEWALQRETLELRCARLEGEIDQRKTRCEKLERAVAEVTEERESAKQCLEDAMELARKYKSDATEAQNRSRAVSEERSSEATQLTAVVSALRKEVEDASSVANERQVLLDDAEHRIAALETCLAIAKDECSKLQEDAAMSDKAAENLLNDVMAGRKEIEALTARLHEASERSVALAEEVSAVRAQTVTLQTANDGLDSDVAEHLATIETMQRAIAELETMLDSVGRERQDALQERDAAALQVQTLQSDLVEAAAHRQDLEASLQTCRSNAAEQQELFVELQQANDVATDAMQTLQQRVRALQEESHRMSSKFLEAEAKYLSASTSVEDLTRSLEETTRTADKLEQDVARLETELKSALEKVHELEPICDDLRQAVGDLTQQSEAQAEMHKAEAHVLQTNLDNAEHALETLRAAHAQLEKDLGSAQADRDLYVGELGSARRQHTDLETIISTKIEQLTQDREMAEQASEAAQDALTSEKQRCEQTLRRYNEALDDNHLLKAQLGEAKKLSAQWKASSEQLRQRTNDLEANKAELEHLVGQLRADQKQLEADAGAAASTSASALHALEAALEAVRSENTKLNARLVRMKQAFDERTAKDQSAMDAYITQQSSEREAIVNRYNVLYETYKEQKRQLLRCTCPGGGATTGGDGEGVGDAMSSATASASAQLSTTKQQLDDALTRLKQLVDVCRKQEEELKEHRHDAAIFHRALESQLERSTMVDVNHVLRDRSVTVHQLNTNEGPRRQPKRRAPSTLLGPAPGSSSGGYRGSLGDGQGLSSGSQRTSTSAASLPASQQREDTTCADHHHKMHRRSANTPLEEHNANVARRVSSTL